MSRTKYYIFALITTSLMDSSSSKVELTINKTFAANQRLLPGAELVGDNLSFDLELTLVYQNDRFMNDGLKIKEINPTLNSDLSSFGFEKETQSDRIMENPSKYFDNLTDFTCQYKNGDYFFQKESI